MDDALGKSSRKYRYAKIGESLKNSTYYSLYIWKKLSKTTKDKVNGQYMTKCIRHHSFTCYS